MSIGQQNADDIAGELGLVKSETFTESEYIMLVTGKGGVPVPDPLGCTKLIDESVRILTNTTGNPLHSKVKGQKIATVLASYGLMVDEKGWLQSPANSDAPTRQVNDCLDPFGYLTQWAYANGAIDSLKMLYKSAYWSEAAYSLVSQQLGGAAQLVTNDNGAVVGMPLVPALWNVNFCLIYTLNPKLAANMPAYWAPIPADVAKAITKSPKGRVRFKDYASYFPEGTWYPVH